MNGIQEVMGSTPTVSIFQKPGNVEKSIFPGFLLFRKSSPFCLLFTSANLIFAVYNGSGDVDSAESFHSSLEK